MDRSTPAQTVTTDAFIHVEVTLHARNPFVKPFAARNAWKSADFGRGTAARAYCHHLRLWLGLLFRWGGVLLGLLHQIVDPVLEE